MSLKGPGPGSSEDDRETRLRRFLVRVAGLSRAQVTRLLRQHRTAGGIADRRGPRHRPSPAAYSDRPTSGCSPKSIALHGHPLRARHPPALHPGLARVRRPPLRAPRRHLQRTSLQPAPLDQLSAPPRDDARDDPPRAHRHRRAPPAPARRTTCYCGSIPSTRATSTASRAYRLNLVDEVTQFQLSAHRAIETPCLAPVSEAVAQRRFLIVRGFLRPTTGYEFQSIARSACRSPSNRRVPSRRPRRATTTAPSSKNGSYHASTSVRPHPLQTRPRQRLTQQSSPT